MYNFYFFIIFIGMEDSKFMLNKVNIVLLYVIFASCSLLWNWRYIYVLLSVILDFIIFYVEIVMWDIK